MKSGLIKAGVAVVVLAVAAVVGLKFYHSSTLNGYEEQVKAGIKKSDVYLRGDEADKKYLDAIVENGLYVAREANGGGFLAMPPSKSEYHTALYQWMVNETKKSDREAMARSLRMWAVGQGYMDVQP